MPRSSEESKAAAVAAVTALVLNNVTATRECELRLIFSKDLRNARGVLTQVKATNMPPRPCSALTASPSAA